MMVTVRQRSHDDRWHLRSRRRLRGDGVRPRLSVFKSSREIYVQVVDDRKGETLFGLSTKLIREGGKTERSFELGKRLAQKLLSLKISKVVFDRGGHRYHGRIKALAEGTRSGGLEF